MSLESKVLDINPNEPMLWTVWDLPKMYDYLCSYDQIAYKIKDVQDPVKKQKLHVMFTYPLRYHMWMTDRNIGPNFDKKPADYKPTVQ